MNIYRKGNRDSFIHTHPSTTGSYNFYLYNIILFTSTYQVTTYLAPQAYTTSTYIILYYFK